MPREDLFQREILQIFLELKISNLQILNTQAYFVSPLTTHNCTTLASVLHHRATQK
jgi:hypothetical protein